VIFSRPWAFVLLLCPLMLTALAAAAVRYKRRTMTRIGDPAVLSKLTDPLASRHQAVKTVFLVVAGLLFVMAAAGPRWGQSFQEIRRRGIDVLLAVDVSASMMAEDIKPNRLEQAKRELGLFIDRLEGDRVGVVAFAGRAFLQCPLTLDYAAARMLLDMVGPDLIPSPGTSIAEAIETAAEAFGSTEKKYKALILLTDGEDHSGKLGSAVQKASSEGVRLFAIGFGNPQGEIIPVRDSQGRLREYKKDRSGRTVVSKLDEDSLRQMAERTGGRYYRATAGEIEVDRVLDDIRSMEKKSLESRVFDQYEDRTGWFVGLALMFLMLEFFWPETEGHFPWVFRQIRQRMPALRFGSLKRIGVVFLVSSFGAQTAFSMGRVSSAHRDYRRGDYARSAEKYKELSRKNPGDARIHFNLGDSLYRQEDYPAAVDAFNRAQESARHPAVRSRSAYNAGNALYRQGRYQEAIEKYKQALRLNPRDPDAKHNLEFALKALKSQQRQNEKKSGDDKKDGPPSGTGRDPQGDPKDGKDREEQIRQMMKEADADKMSKEDAERLLKAVENQEKEAREKMKAAQPEPSGTEEDW